MFISRKIIVNLLATLGYELDNSYHKGFGSKSSYSVNDDLLRDTCMRIRNLEQENTELAQKVNILTKHLGLKYHTTCTEQLPKFIKIKKGGK